MVEGLRYGKTLEDCERNLIEKERKRNRNFNYKNKKHAIQMDAVKEWQKGL